MSDRIVGAVGALVLLIAGLTAGIASSAIAARFGSDGGGAPVPSTSATPTRLPDDQVLPDFVPDYIGPNPTCTPGFECEGPLP